MSTNTTSANLTSTNTTSENPASTNPMQACLDIFTAPSIAFNNVKGKKGWAWLPFFLVISVTAGVFVHYFSVVDINWFQEQSLEQTAALTGMSYEEIKDASPQADASSAMLQSVISVILALIVMNLLSAVYYLLATKVTAKNDFSFKDWFAFSWWTTLPTILSSFVSILVIFFATNNNISMNDLQPTSLNSLIFSVEQSSAWYTLLETITLFNLWIIAIASIGLKVWLNINTKKAVVLAVIPSVVLYGLWVLYIAI